MAHIVAMLDRSEMAPDAHTFRTKYGMQNTGRNNVREPAWDWAMRWIGTYLLRDSIYTFCIKNTVYSNWRRTWNAVSWDTRAGNVRICIAVETRGMSGDHPLICTFYCGPSFPWQIYEFFVRQGRSPVCNFVDKLILTLNW